MGLFREPLALPIQQVAFQLNINFRSSAEGLEPLCRPKGGPPRIWGCPGREASGRSTLPPTLLWLVPERARVRTGLRRGGASTPAQILLPGQGTNGLGGRRASGRPVRVPGRTLCSRSPPFHNFSYYLISDFFFFFWEHYPSNLMFQSLC